MSDHVECPFVFCAKCLIARMDGGSVDTSGLHDKLNVLTFPRYFVNKRRRRNGN